MARFFSHEEFLVRRLFGVDEHSVSVLLDCFLASADWATLMT